MPGSQHASWERQSHLGQGFQTFDMTLDNKSVVLVTGHNLHRLCPG